MGMIVEARFGISQEVSIDGDRALKGLVTRIQVETGNILSYRVAWMSNGVHHAEWLEEWRLSAWVG